MLWPVLWHHSSGVLPSSILLFAGRHAVHVLRRAARRRRANCNLRGLAPQTPPFAHRHATRAHPEQQAMGSLVQMVGRVEGGPAQVVGSAVLPTVSEGGPGGLAVVLWMLPSLDLRRFRVIGRMYARPLIFPSPLIARPFAHNHTTVRRRLTSARRLARRRRRRARQRRCGRQWWRRRRRRLLALVRRRKSAAGPRPGAARSGAAGRAAAPRGAARATRGSGGGGGDSRGACSGGRGSGGGGARRR